MKPSPSWFVALGLVGAALFAVASPTPAADHNDPNAVNSIFSDVPISAADLYDLFGWPGQDAAGGETVVVILTFASIPAAGVFDTDVLYRIRLDPDPRPTDSMEGDSLDAFLLWTTSAKDKYFKLAASEIRVSFPAADAAKVSFLGFPGGDFAKTVTANAVVDLTSPGGHSIKTFFGGRDDAFFNDLPGFFRSINYVPQFYDLPREQKSEAEAKIPKTLLELEGNALFNFDPARPRHGQGEKLPLPEPPFTWEGDAFARDAEGNYRFVYSGRDAQAGIDVNTLAFELPLAFLTASPAEERVVRTWAESWVLRASAKAGAVPREEPGFFGGIWAWIAGLFASEPGPGEDLADFHRVDTVGVPFLDAALNRREDDTQVGADNISHGRRFVTRLGHLGWGFGPSISALGLGTCFDHDDAPVSVHRTYKLATTAFPRAKKCLFQRLNMPDDSWQRNGVEVRLKRTFEVFIPNVTNIDMDTTGTWPYGRRLEDQVATRFLSVFLDMEEGCGGGPCHVESLADAELLASAPILPKTPPNPLANDVPFLDTFPYLAPPRR